MICNRCGGETLYPHATDECLAEARRLRAALAAREAERDDAREALGIGQRTLEAAVRALGEAEEDKVDLAKLLDNERERGDVMQRERDEARADLAACAKALRVAERAMNAQVALVHAREVHFRDARAQSRPLDWQPMVAEMYGMTAEPLRDARAALSRPGVQAAMKEAS